MINGFEIENFGPIKTANIKDLGRINLIIGENSVGKTYLLKALYSVHKSVEEFGKGDDIKKINDIIADKLRWTFQADSLGELVNDSSQNACSISIADNNQTISMRFGKKATVAILDVMNNITDVNYNSAFIPAREVFSIQKIILRSRDIDKVFGFDDSQYDLAKALQLMPSNEDSFMIETRKTLLDMMGGEVKLDEKNNKWQYVKNGVAFTIGTASDGIRKLGMIERLLENEYISTDSVIFIDEIEAGLHPKAILKLMDLIGELVKKSNMQFFITSHSYFVIKKMRLMALQNKEQKDYIKCLLPSHNVFISHDLKDGMPNNPIIEESIALYEQEIEEGM